MWLGSGRNGAKITYLDPLVFNIKEHEKKEKRNGCVRKLPKLSSGLSFGGVALESSDHWSQSRSNGGGGGRPFEPGLTFQPLVHTCHSFPLSRPLRGSSKKSFQTTSGRDFELFFFLYLPKQIWSSRPEMKVAVPHFSRSGNFCFASSFSVCLELELQQQIDLPTRKWFCDSFV